MAWYSRGAGQTRSAQTLPESELVMSKLSAEQKHILAVYPHCPRREKRQHFDKALLPFPVLVEGAEVFDANTLEKGPKVGTFKVVGMCNKRDPFVGDYHDAEAIEVTLLDGTIVPATRLVSDDDKQYVICQNYSYKAKRV